MKALSMNGSTKGQRESEGARQVGRRTHGGTHQHPDHVEPQHQQPHRVAVKKQPARQTQDRAEHRMEGDLNKRPTAELIARREPLAQRCQCEMPGDG